MEGLFDTIITFIPIAIIIAVRIAASKKKQNDEKKEKKESTFAKFMADKMKPPESPPARGHWEEDTDDDDDFSPFALSNGTGTYSKTVFSGTGKEPVPVRASPVKNDWESISEPLSESMPEFVRASVSAEARLAVPAKPVPEADVSPQQERSRKGASLPEKLESLTPMQRAVVMAEVLGPPKGA
ncbi:hypothetical protein [Breznakiella homolactica]|uniref:Uncharacterized protein n=1 Tax=Breznakiella homolactica TaxID=2798577 RepID=A0A7T7XQC1_9SPIR|nr:hypothetical protein [Breznakiella homolactica]QQO10447.1 hypothetical protein JFL75_05895 [Breznakiella homolactica]